MILPQNPAADGTGGIFHHRKFMLSRNFENCVQVARHPHLVNTKNRACALADGRLDFAWINIERRRVDVDEDRHGPAVANAVRGGDVGVAYGDDFIARAHADGQQRKVKRGGAAGDRACVRRTDEGGKLTFKRRNLGALRDPARQNHASCSRNFFWAEMWARHGNEIFRHGWGRPEAPSCAQLPAPTILLATSLGSRTNREDEPSRRVVRRTAESRPVFLLWNCLPTVAARLRAGAQYE